MSQFDVDVLIVGAGVVGLATGRAFALQGRDVLVIERGGTVGGGISSRNSEVIHSGIYYPRGSLKARACVAGRDRLYVYCAERGIPHSRCGKLIVLAPGQDPARLDDLHQRAAANGVIDLARLSREQVAALEPELVTDGALLSPSTGIIDSHAFMQSLHGDIENAGGIVAFDAPLIRGDVRHGLRIWTGGSEPAEIVAKVLINCAGLDSIFIPAALEGFPDHHRREAYFAKGNYFRVDGKCPFKHLVYPLPEAAGLGIHATIDLGGSVRFGPDVEWVTDHTDFTVDPARAERFYDAIRSYWPGLRNGSLSPAYSGIRPKLGGAGTQAFDFIVEGPRTHGIPGLFNLLGIESPGLTSSLALADHVVAELSGETGP